MLKLNIDSAIDGVQRVDEEMFGSCMLAYAG